MSESKTIRARLTSYTEDTFEMALDLATKIAEIPDLANRAALDLAYVIEEELDKRIRDGTLYLLARQNRR